MVEVTEDPDVVLEGYVNERREIDEFARVYEALLTPVDLKDTMAGYLPAFLASLHTVKKLHKLAEKLPEKATKAMREKIVSVIRMRITEVLQILKAIMLVRHVDRSIREKSIRAIK